MSDRSDLDQLAEKHERIDEERIEAVLRWVEYMKEQPVEVWGPQQNAVVNAQVEAARKTGLTAEHEQRVREIAEELADEE